MIVFRHAHPSFPFVWSKENVCEGRWNRANEGPVNYFADTPDGAWAEFLRHEEIREIEDLSYVRRALWAVEIPDEADVYDVSAEAPVSRDVLVGDPKSYAQCQQLKDAAMRKGFNMLKAPSAALARGSRGVRVSGGTTRPGPVARETIFALFGDPCNCTGWMVVETGAPPRHLLEDGLVRYATELPTPPDSAALPITALPA
jgi:hypothetical protein